MGGNERNWILVKVDDEYADPGHDVAQRRHDAVLSDRRLSVDG